MQTQNAYWFKKYKHAKRVEFWRALGSGIAGLVACVAFMALMFLFAFIMQ